MRFPQLSTLLLLPVLKLTVYAEVDFARDIQPILNANCIECHGGVKAAGDVSFVYEGRVINFEGKSGSPVVTPGDVDASEMFYRVTTDEFVYCWKEGSFVAKEGFRMFRYIKPFFPAWPEPYWLALARLLGRRPMTYPYLLDTYCSYFGCSQRWAHRQNAVQAAKVMKK
mgnify:FL=1|jgi:hypothetical protein